MNTAEENRRCQIFGDKDVYDFLHSLEIHYICFDCSICPLFDDCNLRQTECFDKVIEWIKTGDSYKTICKRLYNDA